MREQLAELRRDIESSAWEGEEEETKEEAEHVPNMDAFQDLMNICKAVQTLQ